MSTTKIPSALSILAVALGFAVSVAGCAVDAGPGTVVTTTDPPPETSSTPDVTIDTGAQMSAGPGDGVGLFVQYQGDGRWDLFTTCDTATSGTPCNFDVVVSPTAGAFSGVLGTDLGPQSSVALQSDGSIRLVTETDMGTDGVSFDADPGATIEVDVLLDGASQPQFIFAVSGGATLDGMPSDPVDFTPDAP